jgi:hypothetical protein
MGILSRLVSLPVMGPIDGVLWLARTIAEQAEAECWDESKITGALAELEIDLDMRKIDIDEYEMREAELLERLKHIREAKNEH